MAIHKIHVEAHLNLKVTKYIYNKPHCESDEGFVWAFGEMK